MDKQKDWFYLTDASDTFDSTLYSLVAVKEDTNKTMIELADEMNESLRCEGCELIGFLKPILQRDGRVMLDFVYFGQDDDTYYVCILIQRWG